MDRVGDLLLVGINRGRRGGRFSWLLIGLRKFKVLKVWERERLIYHQDINNKEPTRRKQGDGSEETRR